MACIFQFKVKGIKVFQKLFEKCLNENIPEEIKGDALSGDCGMYAILEILL